MTNEEAQQLDHGIYRLTWNSGGTSVAAVGGTYNGTRWYLPTNWTSGPSNVITASTDWSQVASAKLLIPGVIDRSGDAIERRRRQQRSRTRYARQK